MFEGTGAVAPQTALAHAQRTGDDAVVVLVELQPEIMRGNRTTPETELRRAVSMLVEGTGALGVPIIRTVIALTPGVVPATIEELSAEPPVVRSTAGVFDDPESRSAIDAQSRPVVAIGGISSEIAFLHAVLGARRLGYAVHVLVDACGGFSKRMEQAAFRQMESAGATLSSVASFLTSMTPSLNDLRARAVFGSLSRLWT